MFVGGIDGGLLSVDTDIDLLVLSILYAFVFSIVLLNVLVAVIFDAWGRVSPRGRMFYWKFRHEFVIETTGDRKLLSWLGFIGSSSRLNRIEQHVENVVERFLQRPEKSSAALDWSNTLKEAGLYFAEGAYLLLWFLLGLMSAGMLWPCTFRKAIFTLAEEEQGTLGTMVEKENPEANMIDASSEIIELRDQMEELKGLILHLTRQ